MIRTGAAPTVPASVSAHDAAAKNSSALQKAILSPSTFMS